ncbi:MAG: CbtA family protein [Aeromicrobium erythreum]
MTLTPRSFLVHGLLAGLVGAILAFGVAYTWGEPPVDQAIAVEEAGTVHSHGGESVAAHGGGHDEGGISRSQQSGPGLATGIGLLGLALGGIAGLASAFAAGRTGSLTPPASSAVVALLGFVSIGLVPFLKYPPNPPAVGSGDTIGQRTADYFSMMGLSIVAVVAAFVLVRALRSRGTAVALAAGVLLYGAVVGSAYALLPAVDEVPDTFPADTLYDFRIASILTQGALWAGIGVTLAFLVGRAWQRQLEQVARRELAQSL